MDTEYLKRVGLYILGAVLSIGLVLYFGYHIWRSVTKEVETQPVTKITAQRTVETDGYIFRSESPVFVSGGTSAVPTVSEGEKVNVGGSIADVYAQSAPDVVAHIAEIEDQIDLLRQSISGKNASSKDSSSIDRDIFSSLSGIRTAAGVGNAGDAVALRAELLSAVNRRGLLTGSVSDFNADITALEQEKASLTASLGSKLQSVSAPSSGFYYSSTDGYEKIFDPALFEEMTYDSVCSLLSSAPETWEQSCVGKMVTSSVWYTVLRADRKYINTFAAGTFCKVNFKANEMTLDMKVEKVLEGSGEAVFILSTREVPTGFDYTRVQKIELVEAEYTGLRVPVGAVRIVNGETGVYILDGSTVRFRSISVLYRGDGICIVDPGSKDDAGENEDQDTNEDESSEKKTRRLELHDNLITGGKGLYDGRVIGS